MDWTLGLKGSIGNGLIDEITHWAQSSVVIPAISKLGTIGRSHRFLNNQETFSIFRGTADIIGIQRYKANYTMTSHELWNKVVLKPDHVKVLLLFVYLVVGISSTCEILKYFFPRPESANINEIVHYR